MPRRKSPRPIDPNWPKPRWAHLRRTVMKRLKKFAASGEYRRMMEDDAAKAAKEKAPGLAAEGSSDLVIPGEDPEPQETQALAEVPVRRATRWTGMTVLTD